MAGYVARLMGDVVGASSTWAVLVMLRDCIGRKRWLCWTDGLSMPWKRRSGTVGITKIPDTCSHCRKSRVGNHRLEQESNVDKKRIEWAI